ncbi:MAG TPA: cytochrome P450 [Acidimicrobiales bacterium]|nr:cytochrome P450 [Acidimicrobiales bacterium]
MAVVNDQSGTEEFDPFEAFGRTHGAGVVRDPYPRFAELRREAPVHRGGLAGLTGFASDLPTSEGWGESPGQEFFTAFSHAAVERVYREAATFSSKTADNEGMELVMGHTILNMDEPEHRAYRGLVQQPFSRAAMARWEAEVVRPVIDASIDAFVERGSADLVSELTFSFPVRVIAALLGLPAEDLGMFHRLAVQLLLILTDIELGLSASQELGTYFSAVAAERRGQPTDDVISILANAELDGQRLTDEEIAAFLRLLLPAGAETTYRSSSNLLVGLLSDRGQWEAIVRDRSLIPAAIEEGLRWEPPLTMTARTCVKDTVLEGVPLPAGASVTACIGAANHDDARWDEPERFDIRREPKQHLAFAYGPHMCLGMHLARLETSCLLNALADRLPNLRLDPEADDVHISGLVFRTPARLPVLFDAA